MEQHQQVQINCPHFRNVIVNGNPVSGCLKSKEFITSQNIHDFCLGDKCELKKLG